MCTAGIGTPWAGRFSRILIVPELQHPTRAASQPAPLTPSTHQPLQQRGRLVSPGSLAQCQEPAAGQVEHVGARPPQGAQCSFGCRAGSGPRRPGALRAARSAAG